MIYLNLHNKFWLHKCILIQWLDNTNTKYLGLKKNTRVSIIKPDWLWFFCADPAIFIGFQKKNKKIFIPTDPKMFQKIGQKA